MRFSLLISSHPSLAASHSALKFCRAVFRQGHTIHRIFFLADGVLNSSPGTPLHKDWKDIIQEHNIDAVCCINSSIKSGLVTPDGRAKDPSSLFHYSGLGQLIEASVSSDRLVTFGQR